MECYLELARRNEPVNKAEKVIDFFLGLRPPNCKGYASS